MNFKQNISKSIYENSYRYQNETVDDTFRRVAHEVSKMEKDSIWEEEFYQMMKDGYFIPAGRIIANAGTKLKYYNNCYTIDIEDSIEGIYKALAEDAIISKTGGGVGFNISPLRPRNAPLSRGGYSSGAVSFLKVFNESAKVIQVGGSQRRSAHIALLDISHPDIEEFITCKRGDLNKELTQFNISVKITDEFVNAVKNNLDWDLTFDGKIYKTVKAVYLFELLTNNMFIHNEPGLFFVDTINKYNNAPYKIEQCNPCGEAIMGANELCILGSLNLTKFVKNPFEDAIFDFELFDDVIRKSVRFLDNVVSVTKYPLKKIEENSKKYRRIGLGFTGLGDTFAMMKMKYGSKESISLSEKIAKSFRNSSYLASSDLAKEKGAFPAYGDYIFESEFIKNLPNSIKKKIRKDGLRSVAIQAIAPTGTISMAFGNNCSSGIEPIFELEYVRTIKQGDGHIQEKVKNNAWMLYQEKYSDTPNFFTTSSQIDPISQIEIQSVIQKYVDSGISKTCNLPNEYTIEEFRDLFFIAYEKELKGWTSYNPMGSLRGILNKSFEDDRPMVIKRQSAPKRPKELHCEIHKSTTLGDNYIVLVGLLNGSVYEVFIGKLKGYENISNYKNGIIRKKKKGEYELILLDSNGVECGKEYDIAKTFTTKRYNTLARMVSMSLRHGTPLEFVIEQLKKGNYMLSFEKSLARVLNKYISDGEMVKSSLKCDSCGKTVFVFESGCQKCISCGWSKCD